jgi:hypothetical protein
MPNCSDNKLDLLQWFWISAKRNTCKQLTVKFTESSSEIFIKGLSMNIGERRFSEFDGSLFTCVFSVEIQDNLSPLDESYSSFHIEFGMSS